MGSSNMFARLFFFYFFRWFALWSFRWIFHREFHKKPPITNISIVTLVCTSSSAGNRYIIPISFALEYSRYVSTEKYVYMQPEPIGLEANAHRKTNKNKIYITIIKLVKLVLGFTQLRFELRRGAVPKQ